MSTLVNMTRYGFTVVSYTIHVIMALENNKVIKMNIVYQSVV